MGIQNTDLQSDEKHYESLFFHLLKRETLDEIRVIKEKLRVLEAKLEDPFG